MRLSNYMRKLLFTFILITTTFATRAQNTYYPPISQTAFWDTLSPQSQGWCNDSINSLYQYLAKENSKAFILLVDGKIVLEKYFGTFTKDSSWYWASAGKTLTAFLVGKAREEGKLSLNDKSSDYLGSGWSSLTQAQEDAITIRHQLTMTTGLDDGVSDNHCTLKSCLIYKADPGTRWAYHNAPYTLLDKVIETATGSTMKFSAPDRGCWGDGRGGASSTAEVATASSGPATPGPRAFEWLVGRGNISPCARPAVCELKVPACFVCFRRSSLTW